MLGLGFGEMIVLAGIALVVMGPERFPGLAKTFIKTVRDIRGYWEEAQDEFRKETDPMRREFRELDRAQKKFTKDLEDDDWMDPAMKKEAEAGYGAWDTDPSKEKQPGEDEMASWEEAQDLGPYPYSEEYVKDPDAQPDAPAPSAETTATDAGEPTERVEPTESADEYDVEPPERLD